MKGQRALHLIFGATIALGVKDNTAVSADRGPGGGGRQPPSASRRGGRLPPSSNRKDGRSSYSSSSSRQNQQQRSVDDILDLDGLMMDDIMEDDEMTFFDEDDVDGLMESLRNSNNDGNTASLNSNRDAYGMDTDNMDDDEFDYSDGDDFDPLLDSEEEDMMDGGDSGLMMGGEQQDEYGQGSEKGALYDAYNLLHSLAQDFKKPFDAPAVVVVGHQSSGKSALIEALMGFQFNQVGGGTKTRRPIALRMQYNPRCSHPRCFLQGDDNIERPKSLNEIQEYIEAENKRLEKDPVRSFDGREINVRMEYKYCPNMILIDTPGLISAPRVRKEGTGANPQQRALSRRRGRRNAWWCPR